VVAKRYVVAIIAVTAAIVGTCSRGLAANAKPCVSECASRYATDMATCPTLRRDTKEYFWCVVKAQDAQEACNLSCPQTSANIGTDPLRKPAGP
jgi:hypothetical protein